MNISFCVVSFLGDSVIPFTLPLSQVLPPLIQDITNNHYMWLWFTFIHIYDVRHRLWFWCHDLNVIVLYLQAIVSLLVFLAL